MVSEDVIDKHTCRPRFPHCYENTFLADESVADSCQLPIGLNIFIQPLRTFRCTHQDDILCVI